MCWIGGVCVCKMGGGVCVEWVVCSRISIAQVA